MDPTLSLLVGPLGQSFRIFKEYGMFPKNVNFFEFSDELYERYYKVIGMPSCKLFLFVPVDFTGKTEAEIEAVKDQYIIENYKELPTVTEIEKREMLKAVEFVLKMTESLPHNASDQERITRFLNLYPMFE